MSALGSATNIPAAVIEAKTIAASITCVAVPPAETTPPAALMRSGIGNFTIAS
jgi:hypothetical protein